jgi:hypothetical protein
MNPNTTKALLAVLIGTGLSQGSLSAQNTFFTNGDLILFFQKPGDDDTIYVGLGSAATLYRGSAAGPTADRAATNIVNINAALTAAYGSGWASDTEIYSGLIACRSSATGAQVFDGDHTRTIYASRSRTAVGTVGAPGSSAWDFTLSGASTGAAGQIVTFNNSFETRTTTQVALLPLVDSLVDDQNPFISVPLGIQDTAFYGFAGGVQQRGSAASFGAFGPVADAEFLHDLWRVTARPDSETAGAEVPGVSRVGSYEGTIVIGADGNVSFVTTGGGASSAFTTWIDSFNPPLANPADRVETADPDSDGATNLQEFGFGGNPASGSDSGTGQVLTVDANGDTQRDITLTLQVRSGATFSVSGNALVSAPVDELIYRIEGSIDLASWDSAVSEVTSLGSGSPKAGYVFKTFRLNAGSGLPGKGFLRASVTK